MRQYSIRISTLLGDVEQHVNQTGMIPPDERTAEALCGFLCSLGVIARPESNGGAVAIYARSATTYARLHFALVCHLAASSYRSEAFAWATIGQPPVRTPMPTSSGLEAGVVREISAERVRRFRDRKV
jgi:hypothetical protein